MIKNIIFDLGGVLLNLDFDRTFRAFDRLGVPGFAAYFQQSKSNPLFSRLETGAITPDAFYDAFRKEAGITADNQSIQAAWNAMLLDFRTASVAYLQELRGTYRVFLLSNTNQIHLEAFRAIHFNQFGHHGFDTLFEKTWYSHLLGQRKPDVSCYAAALANGALQAQETLFVDDTEINIAGAQAAGLHTCLLPKGATIETVLPPMLA